MTQGLCETIRERLSELIEGDLPPVERGVAEEHLRDCEGCAREARVLRETLDALRSLPKAEPPPDMVSRIDRALDGRSARRRPGRTRLRRHAVAMILVVGILVGIVRVLPHDPGLLGERRASLPPARPAPRDQATGTEAEETRPAADEDRAASRGGTVAPPEAAREAAPAPAATRVAPAAAPAPSARQQAAMKEAGRGKEIAEARKDEAMQDGRGAIGEVASETGAVAPSAGSALDLLRDPHPDAAWAESVRRLIVDRPEHLARAWKALSPRQQAEVLANWRRAASFPAARRDLDTAMARTRDPALIPILRAFRESAP